MTHPVCRPAETFSSGLPQCWTNSRWYQCTCVQMQPPDPYKVLKSRMHGPSLGAACYGQTYDWAAGLPEFILQPHDRILISVRAMERTKIHVCHTHQPANAQPHCQGLNRDLPHVIRTGRCLQTWLTTSTICDCRGHAALSHGVPLCPHLQASFLLRCICTPQLESHRTKQRAALSSKNCDTSTLVLVRAACCQGRQTSA